MKKRHSIFSYPIVVKKVQGFLVFRMPDLELTHVIELPPQSKLTPTYLFQVAKTMARLWLKAQEQLNRIEEANRTHVYPRPSSVKESLQAKADVELSAPKVARILGVHPDTVRRAAERGQIPFSLTAGGHRRFLERDVEKLKKRLLEVNLN